MSNFWAHKPQIPRKTASPTPQLYNNWWIVRAYRNNPYLSTINNTPMLCGAPQWLVDEFQIELSGLKFLHRYLLIFTSTLCYVPEIDFPYVLHHFNSSRIKTCLEWLTDSFIFGDCWNNMGKFHVIDIFVYMKIVLIKCIYPYLIQKILCLHPAEKSLCYVSLHQ